MAFFPQSLREAWGLSFLCELWGGKLNRREGKPPAKVTLLSSLSGKTILGLDVYHQNPKFILTGVHKSGVFRRVRLMGFLPGLTNHSYPPPSASMLPLSPTPTNPPLQRMSQLGVHNPAPSPFHSTLAAGVRGREQCAFEVLTPSSATDFAVSHSLPWPLV